MEQEGEKPALSGPGMRLMLLWLATAPLAMLGLAIFIAVLAVGEGNWGLLSAMIVLGMLAVVLFVAQRWVLRRYLER